MQGPKKKVFLPSIKRRQNARSDAVVVPEAFENVEKIDVESGSEKRKPMFLPTNTSLLPDDEEQEPTQKMHRKVSMMAVITAKQKIKRYKEYLQKANTEYTRLQRLVQDSFGNSKLNIKRAEVFMRNNQRTKLYRELMIYLVYLCLFFGLVIGLLPISQNYEHAGILLDCIFGNPNNDVQWDAVETAELWYEWVSTRLVGVLNDSEGCMMFYEQIGLARLRQIRSTHTMCTYLGVTSPCYDQWSEYTDGETQPFGPASDQRKYLWSTGHWNLEPNLSFGRDHNYMTSYGNGGYVVDLPRNPDNATELISELQSDRWVSPATRAVVAAFSLFNRHTGLYTVAEFLLEFPISGHGIPSQRVTTVHLISLTDPTELAFCALFCVFVIGYAASEFVEFRDYGFVIYLREPWNLLEVLAIILSIVNMGVVGTFVALSRATEAAILENPNDRYIDLQTCRQTLTTVQNIVGINILLASLRVFKFLRLNAKLNLLWTTLSFAFWDLFAFLQVWIIMFVGYAFMGHVIFGHAMADYHNFTSSFLSLFAFIGGSFNYSDFNQANPVTGTIFFVTFMIFMFLILVNVFIAILGRNYEKACNQVEKKEHEAQKSMTPEDRFSVISKIRKLKVYLIAFSDEVPRVSVVKGTKFKIWLNVSVDQAEAEAPPSGIITCPSAKSIECYARGKLAYLRFLPEILRPNVPFWLHSKRPNTFPLKLRASLVRMTPHGMFLECVSEHEGCFHSWMRLKLSMWHSIKYVVIKYTIPTASRYWRGRNLLRHYRIKEPEQKLFRDNEVASLVSELNKALEKWEEKEDHTRRSARPRLDVLLEEIRFLQRSCEASRRDIDKTRINDLVEKAILVDTCLAQLGGLGRTVANFLEPTGGLHHPSTDVTGKLFSTLMDELEQLERQISEVWAVKLDKSKPRSSLRFDELCAQLRLLLAKKHRSGYSQADIKKTAVAIMASFSIDCYDPIDKKWEFEHYIPRPYDTKSVRDSDNDPFVLLGELVDLLGEVIHDNWSLNKLKDGWSYGPTRSNNDRIHNCLVPYSKLTKQEKAYDLDMVAQALRMIVLFGYHITPPKDHSKKELVPIPNLDEYRSCIPDDYTLRFIDTTNVELNDGLCELRDLLAENAHDLWAAKRRDQGWTFGECLDEAKKTHNLMIPYGLMTDEQRKSDLSTITETIRTVLALGYTIEPSRSDRLLKRIVGLTWSDD